MCGIQRVLRNPTQSVWYVNNVYILCVDQNSNNPLIDISCSIHMLNHKLCMPWSHVQV